MRLVLDTVVVVRALIKSRSYAGRILFDYHHNYDWVVSSGIVAEYMEVTERPKITQKYVVDPNRDRAMFIFLLQQAILVSPSFTPAICRDPNDDKFLAAALAGNAMYIVSEDLDLIEMRAYEGIPIVSTQAMIDLLTARDAQP